MGRGIGRCGQQLGRGIGDRVAHWPHSVGAAFLEVDRAREDKQEQDAKDRPNGQEQCAVRDLVIGPLCNLLAPAK